MAHEILQDRKSSASERRPRQLQATERAMGASPASSFETLRSRVGNLGAQILYRQLSGQSGTGAGAQRREENPEQARASPVANITLSQPGDASEQEADRVAEIVMRMREPAAQSPAISPASPAASFATVQRLCADCEEESANGKSLAQPSTMAGGKNVHRKEVQGGMPLPSAAISSGIAALRGGGKPLPSATRAFFEPRFGVNFGDVRVYTGPPAEETARGINAKAFTIGRNIAFAKGQYAPESHAGKRLLAHELTHVVQQGTGASQTAAASVQRAIGDGHDLASPRFKGNADLEGCYDDETRLTMSGKGRAGTKKVDHGPAVKAVQDALVELGYLAPAESTGRYNQATWDAVRKLKKDKGLGWEDMGDVGPGTMGWLDKRFAAVPPACPPCPYIGPPAPGCPPCPPIPPAPTACTLPVRLALGRTNCGITPDFGHFDFPPLSMASKTKLYVWAAAHSRNSYRDVPDIDCMAEMDAVLTRLASSSGHEAFLQFVAGSGSTVVHGPASTLGFLALGCSSFQATVSQVKKSIERQLASQARGGALDPCALSVSPLPATHFDYIDGFTLKSVIGGTHGERLFATSFAGNISTRTYTISLRFVICDNFGVAEEDLYAPGLMPFWVLQHERSPTRFAPFINELDLPVTVSGTF